MPDLSPQAQAVRAAAQAAYWLPDQECPGEPDAIAAAALRAAADQACPSDAMEPRNYLPMAMENDRIRSELLAIAAELEADQ